MKEKFLKVISLLKNKRYRAITIVILYFAFFAIMFLILSIKRSMKENNTVFKIKEYKDYTNYSFSVELNINDEKYNYFGKRYNNSYEVNYNDQVYNFKFGDDIELERNVYDSLNYDPILNNEFIKNSKLISETKLLEDSIIEKKYNLDVCSYGNITDLNVDNCEDSIVVINIGYKDDKVVYIDMNLDDLFGLISEIKKYDIKIIYDDIDSVLAF